MSEDEKQAGNADGYGLRKNDRLTKAAEERFLKSEREREGDSLNAPFPFPVAEFDPLFFEL